MQSLQGAITFAPDEADPWRLGARVQGRFGGDGDALYASVPHAELVGREVAELPELPEGDVHVAVAFDGTIVAVGRTIEQGDDTAACAGHCTTRLKKRFRESSVGSDAPMEGMRS